MNNNDEKKEKIAKRAIFFARLALWALAAVIFPLVYIECEYGIFVSSDSKRTITGWGIVGIIAVGVAVWSAVKGCARGLPKGSMALQCISGYSKLIPLIFIAIACEALKDSIDDLETLIVVITISEAVAIPLNPIPKWAAENNIQLLSGELTKSIKRAASAFKGND